MAESEKDRKKRLAKQSKAAKADRKPATTEKQKETAVKKEESRTEVIRKGIEVKKPASRKKAAAPRRPRGPIVGTAPDTAPKTGKDYRDDNNIKNTAFEESQKERAESEVGGVAALGEEASVAEKQARQEQLDKYQEQVKEVSTSTVPKNEGTIENDPLRPKQEDKFVPPTPAEAAKNASRPARGGSGTGVYTFDSAQGAPLPKKRDVEELKTKRAEKGLSGLPGDENNVNDLALELAKRDYGISKESGKPVNEMDPQGDEPQSIENIYYGHHRRLADVMLSGGLTEQQIKKSAQGTGATVLSKVKYLHGLLKENRAARSAEPINLEKEGITHWIHPTTGVAHAISENHPDMPKMQPIDVAGGEGVNHGFWRAGKSQRVRKDADTGSWVMDKKTGNPNIDATLGWDPDKPVGFNVVTLRGGIKALKHNLPPVGSRSLWEHEVNNLKSDIPVSVSQDSRLQHKAYANRILEDASKSEVDGKVLARTREGEAVPRVKRRSGKIIGIKKSIGRTRQAGFTVDEEGTTIPTKVTTTSRGRVVRPDTIGTSDRSYNPGGSVRLTTGTEVPEITKTVEFASKKMRRKKTAVVGGKTVTRPPVTGVSGGGGALVQSREPAFLPQSTEQVTRSQQFTVNMPKTKPILTEKGKVKKDNNNLPMKELVPGKFTPVSSADLTNPTLVGPQPAWDRPNVIGENEPGVSTAEPITRGKPEVRRVKKSPRSKKTKLVTTPGMTDQMIPGFEDIDNEGSLKPFTKEGPTATVVEGPITSAQEFAERTETYKPASGELRKRIGKVSYTKPADTPIAKPAPTISTQLAKIPGNSPVEQPVSAAPKGGRRKKAETPVVSAPAQESEQLELPGMESVSSGHAGGQQWLRNRQLSGSTRKLQTSSRNVRPTNEEPAEDTRSVAEKFETPTDKIMRGVREKKAEK
jgi:hypothetical protein